jgi:hypothetical protein
MVLDEDEDESIFNVAVWAIVIGANDPPMDG